MRLRKVLEDKRVCEVPGDIMVRRVPEPRRVRWVPEDIMVHGQIIKVSQIESNESNDQIGSN